MANWPCADYEYTKLNMLKEIQPRGVLLSVFGISIISRTPDLSLWVTNMSDRGRQEQPGENLRPDAMLFWVKPQPFQKSHSCILCPLQQRGNPPFIAYRIASSSLSNLLIGLSMCPQGKTATACRSFSSLWQNI